MKLHDKSDEFSENLIIDYADYAKFSVRTVRAEGARKIFVESRREAPGTLSCNTTSSTHLSHLI